MKLLRIYFDGASTELDNGMATGKELRALAQVLDS